MSFQDLDSMTAEHRNAVGFIPQATNARAGLLAERLRPLNRIRPVLERRYLVKGWMDRSAFSVVYGESNVGKTFLALDCTSLPVKTGTVPASMSRHRWSMSPPRVAPA